VKKWLKLLLRPLVEWLHRRWHAADARDKELIYRYLELRWRKHEWAAGIDIARAIGVTPPRIYRLLSEMEEKKIVRCERHVKKFEGGGLPIGGISMYLPMWTLSSEAVVVGFVPSEECS